jgi:hypothetical protein
MNQLRGLKRFVARHRAVAGLIVAVLPLILAACTNGGGSGPAY